MRRLFGFNFSLLHVDHVKLNQRWNYANVISPYFRIYYIDDGEGLITAKTGKVKLEKGYLYMIPSFTVCHLFCNRYLSQYFIHFFEESPEGISLFENARKIIRMRPSKTDVTTIKRLLEINPGRGINRSNNPTVYEKNVYYKSYQELNEKVSDAVYFETKGILLQLIARFLNSRRLRDTHTDLVPSKILDAVRYVQIHLNEHITVSDLASRANLHQDYFSRLFVKHTGQRPLAFLHEKRIERAQYLIATTDFSYFEIAEKTGFDNVPHFSKIFKKVTSLTPGEYKKGIGMM